MHLSLLEHGVYRQLLDLYYLHEQPLDANALRLICARDAAEVQAAENVLKEFFENTPEGWVHKRCEAEIQRFHNKSESARNSANARWQKDENPKNANAMRTQSVGNANHKPITNNKGSRLSSDFEIPTEWFDEALKINQALTDSQIKYIFDGFRDHWVAQAGAKGVKLDWLATWRNWIRRQTGLPQQKERKLSL